MNDNIKWSDVVDWWKNGTDRTERILYRLLILSVLMMSVGIICEHLL